MNDTRTSIYIDTWTVIMNNELKYDLRLNTSKKENKSIYPMSNQFKTY